MIKKTISLFTIILTFLIFSINGVDAKPKKRYKRIHTDITQTYAPYNIGDERYVNITRTSDTKYVAVDRQYGYAAEGRRPSGCPSLWCGCWLSIHIFGQNRKDLWSARAWLKFPRTSPQVGAVVVTARRGGGHVGIVTGFDSDGDPIIKSGNNAGAVRTGPIGRRHVIAYVQPS